MMKDSSRNLSNKHSSSSLGNVLLLKYLNLKTRVISSDVHFTRSARISTFTIGLVLIIFPNLNTYGVSLVVFGIIDGIPTLSFLLFGV